MIKQMKYFQSVVKYQNFTKAAEECYISQSAISQQIQSLENELGIKLIAPPYQEYNEEIFYKEYFGVKGEFVYAENLEEAHLMVVSNRGYFPIEFTELPKESKILKYVPIVHKENNIYRKYYAFWRTESTKKYIEEFAAILKLHF